MAIISPAELDLDFYRCKGTKSTFEIAASIDGKEIGGASLYIAAPKLELMLLDVDPEYRGIGVGSLLVERIGLAAEESRGIQVVETSAYNDRTAKSFCRVFGHGQLRFWLYHSSGQNESVEIPLETNPQEMVEFLEESRSREYGDLSDPRNNEKLSTGVKISCLL